MQLTEHKTSQPSNSQQITTNNNKASERNTHITMRQTMAMSGLLTRSFFLLPNANSNNNL